VKALARLQGRRIVPVMKVFISHAQADKPAADALAVKLRDEGFQVVHPDDDIFPGDNWPLKVGRALEESKAMVVLLSPKIATSTLVQREIDHAIMSRRFKGRLIPVMLKKTSRYPWILNKLGVVAPDSKVIADRIRTAKLFPPQPVARRALHALQSVA
jgi:signal recognition particle subunit SEC65